VDFAAIDFETANEKRASACAVGVVVIENDEIVQVVEHLIQPKEVRFSYHNTRIHGITAEDVKDAPTLTDIWEDIWPVLEGKLVVAHNAGFDFSVLRHSLYANDIEFPELSYLCTVNIARKAWPDLPSHSLGFLAECLDIGLHREDGIHNAANDAEAAARVLLLAGQEKDINCPLELASSLNVTSGMIWSASDWVPSSAVGVRNSRTEFSLEIPDDFDISSHPFFGKAIVFTGTLKLCKRKEAETAIGLLGAIAKGAVSKKTDYLVTGYQDIRVLAEGKSKSSKLRKGEQLRSEGHPIQIITDADFEEILFSPMKDAHGE
jgi:DNA polymerase-3 subunit epsilon